MIGRRRRPEEPDPREAAGAGPTVVRFPGRSVRERRRRRSLLALVVAAALAAVAWVLFSSPLLAVDRVEVTGTTLVDRAEVERRLEPLLGTPLPRVGSGTAERLLAGLPGVAGVSSVALPPTGVEVRVGELAPVASADSGGRSRVLLADGSVLSDVPTDAVGAAAAGRPVPGAADGLFGAGPDVRASAADVLAELPSALAERVRTVAAESPEQVRLTLDDGLVLVWGDAGLPDQKAAVAQTFLAEREKGDRLRGIREVDVSVPARPLMR